MQFIPSTYQLFIVGFVVLLLLLSGFRARNLRAWRLDVQAFFFVLILIYIGSIFFEMSPFSYILMAMFAVIHIIGSKFSYINVPFGYTLGRIFHIHRNIYDRLVHFSFGLLFTYPSYEVFSGNLGLDGISAYYIPFSHILALSAVFEIFEWVRAANLKPDLAEEFIGMQGDIWDSSKDIASAGVGSLIVTAVIFFTNTML